MPVRTPVREREDIQVEVTGAVWWSRKVLTPDTLQSDLDITVEPASDLRALYARLAREYDAMPRPQHFPHDRLGEVHQ